MSGIVLQSSEMGSSMFSCCLQEVDMVVAHKILCLSKSHTYNFEYAKSLVLFCPMGIHAEGLVG